MTTQPSDSSATRDRLLAGAEIEFAEHGFDGASLRGITAAAGTNLAAVNYHFGSKEGLFREVFRRRMGPMNEERLALLDAAAGEGGEQGPSVDAIVRAFVAPALSLKSAPQGDSFLLLMARLYSEPAERVAPLFAMFAEVWERFLSALCRALPDLRDQEVVWRMHFAIGAMSHVLQKLPKPAAGLTELSDEEATESLVTFVAAGFRAPTSERQASDPSISDPHQA